jgi:CTP:molybdopterin cytidylyltransferase MocA
VEVAPGGAHDDRACHVRWTAGIIIRGVRVVAVLLAAGEGRRMGGPKALLRAGGVTFVEACLRALDRPGVVARVVVTGHQAERVAAAVPAASNVTIARNEGYRAGMLSSVLRGLEAAEALGADALLLHPVDHPQVEPETVDRVLDALAGGAPVAVPSHAGRRGHPGGFARLTWDALRAAPPNEGARAVLSAHPDWIVHVPGGPGSVRGVNTPDDLERLT